MSDAQSNEEFKFDVEISDSKSPGHQFIGDGELRVAITHNGYQWQAITSTVDEWKRVVAAIQAHPLYTQGN